MKYFIVLMCFSLSVMAEVLDKYPAGKVTIKVINEKGEPIKDANAGIGFRRLKTSNPFDGQGVGVGINGKTDENGIFAAESSGLSRIGISATKDGYYSSYKEYEFKSRDSGKYQPWNPTIDIVLRKKINPVPMYAKKAWCLPISTGNVPVGYDFLVGDWVKPYGKGDVEDIVVSFKLEHDDAISDTYKYQMEIKSSREEAGFCPIPKEAIIPESGFKFPYEAAKAGYLKNIIFNVDSEKNIRTQEPNGDCFFIRIRTESEKGGIKKAIYGKLIFDKDNNCSLERENNVTKCRISFTYYINPDGTRNIEFDPEKNLFVPPGENGNRFEYNDYSVGL